MATATDTRGKAAEQYDPVSDVRDRPEGMLPPEDDEVQILPEDWDKAKGAIRPRRGE